MIEYREKYKAVTVSNTEDMARELLEEEALTGLFSIEQISRKSSYKVKSHATIMHDMTTNRIEEHLALDMVRSAKEYDLIGKMLDFQVPIKNIRKDCGVGKIDIIAYNGSDVTLLELKAKNSSETLLRCVLEIFTYWKQLDHQKFLYDFGLSQENIVKKAVLVFVDSVAYRQYENKEKYPNTHELMEKLGVELFLLGETDGSYTVSKP